MKRTLMRFVQEKLGWYHFGTILVFVVVLVVVLAPGRN